MCVPVCGCVCLPPLPPPSQTHTHTHIHTHMHTHTGTHTHAQEHRHTGTHIQAHRHRHTDTCTGTYTHTYTGTHTHTHTHTHWAWLHAPSTHYSRRHPVCQACLELLVSPALQGDPGREGERRGEKRKRKWGKVEPHRVQCGRQTTLEGKKWRAKALMYLPGGPGDPSDRDHPGRQEGKQGSV